MFASLSGLSFITPSGAWALATLAIPVLIHLFNRSRGRLVHIGHIDLVRKARRLRVTELKLTQWLLLLLRLGILALAALMMAGLASTGLTATGQATAYVTPAWLKAATPPEIETLLQQGDDTRLVLLRPGFGPLEAGVEGTIRRSPPGIVDFANAWPLLAERLSLERHTGPVDVYASDHMLQFGISRPALPRPVNWVLNHSQQTPEFNSWPDKVVIAHAPERSQDAALFSAALTTLKNHRLEGLNWEVTQSALIDVTHLDADWLILLSLNTPWHGTIKSSLTVLADAGTRPKQTTPLQTTRQTMSLPFYPYTTFSLEQFSKNPANTANTGQTLMASREGWPLLQHTSEGSLRWLQFNSRFDPAWSNLGQQVEFPSLLLQLMLTHEQQTLRHGEARINTARLSLIGDATVTDVPLPRRPLQRLLAVLLVFLWIIERWLSERKANRTGGAS